MFSWKVSGLWNREKNKWFLFSNGFCSAHPLWGAFFGNLLAIFLSEKKHANVQPANHWRNCCVTFLQKEMLYVLLDRKIAAIEFLPIRDIKKSSGNVLFCGTTPEPNVAISGEYFLWKANRVVLHKLKGYLCGKKLAKLRRCVSRVHFAKIHFGNQSLKAVSHSFQKIYHILYGLLTVCNGPETPTQRKSESVTNLPSYWRF